MRMAPATPRAFEAFDRFFEVVDAAVAGEAEADAFRDAFRLLEVRAAEAFFVPVFGLGADVDLEGVRFADDFLAEVFDASFRAGLEDAFFAGAFFAGAFFAGAFFAGAFFAGAFFAAAFFAAALEGADFLDAALFEVDFLEDDFFAPPARFLLPFFLELAAM